MMKMKYCPKNRFLKFFKYNFGTEKILFTPDQTACLKVSIICKNRNCSIER